MATVNLTPLLDSLTGPDAAAAASFRAVAMRAGRGAVRVKAGTVTFPVEVTAAWGADGWDTVPQLSTLPADCYWMIRVASAGTRLEGAYILPDGSATVDFGDLIAVTPDTGQPSTSAIAQYQAVQQYVSNQAARIDTVAATVFGLVATVQAQIEAAEATLVQITQSVEAAANSAAQSAAAAAQSAAAAAQATTVVATLTVVDTGDTLNTSSPAITDLGDGLLYSTAVTDNGDGTLTSA